ncbi:hypothetical protein IKG06_01105 [Candidatus Saccharibacteria bacterium]|nr:hypothetical protein [Candidatus Saccharibacteria bacterium]
MATVTDYNIEQPSRGFAVSLLVIVIFAFSIVANLLIASKTAYGGGGANAGIVDIQPVKPCPSGQNCSGSSSHVAPYWVYFRIKNNKKTSFNVAGETVSGCNGAGGFYFEFNESLSGAQSSVMNAQTSRMYYIDHRAKKTVPTNKYNANDLEPIYLTFHSDGKDYSSKGEVNICSLTSPRKTINKYNAQSGYKIQTLNVGDSRLKDKCNYNRDWGTGFKDSSRNGEQICKGGSLCIWYNIESDIVSYIVDQWNNMIKDNENAGDLRGKKIWDTQTNGDPGNVVNVVWFCGGVGSGNYTGTTTGKIGDKSASVTTSGTKSLSYDGTKTDGKYTINFEHLLKRTDNANSSIPTQTVKIITSTTNLSTNKTTTKTEEINIALEKKGTTGKDSVTTKRSESLTLSPGQKVKVCQTMQYYSFVDYSFESGNFLTNSSNLKKTTVCVTVTQPIYLEPGSASYVTNSVNNNNNSPVTTGGNNTIQGLAGSKGGNKTYSYTFTHKLKLQGKTGYSYGIQYYIVQTKDGTNETIPDSGTQSSPKTLSVNSADGHYVQAFTSRGSWDPIAPGEQTPTICQTIYFKPKQISAGSSYTITKDTWQSSTVCTNVKRSAPKKISASATSDVTVNGVKNPSGTQISVDPYSITFAFKLTTPNSRALTTNYSIQRLIYNTGGTKNWNDATTVKGPTSISAPANVTDSFKKATEDGQALTVCERIVLDPYQYYIEYKGDGKTEDGLTSLSGSKAFAERCVDLGRPQKQKYNDGEAIIYSSSEGRLDNSVYDATQGAYILKNNNTIIYTHKLWRKAEKHTISGKNATSPAEDVNVEYRLDDPNASYNSTSIRQGTGTANGLPSITVPTNSESQKRTTTSNRNSSLLNANTVIDESKLLVGQKKTFCQSIFFVSKQYTLRGEYYSLNGQLWSNTMLGVERPVSKNVVGKSSPGCVSVIRPYNFKVTEISVNSSPETVTGEGEVDVSFTIDVAKNDGAGDYKITDIPNAKIQVIKITLTQPLSPGDSTAGGIATDPCQHFTSRLGAKARCEFDSPADTKTISPGSPNSSSSVSYYNSNGYASVYTAHPSINEVPTTYKVCYAIAINPASSGSKGYGLSAGDFDTGRWVISNAACINIGKRPTVQVWGGSVFSSGGIHTASSRAKVNNESQNRVFGSWADYMIIANGANKNMASGATLISGMLNATTCKYSPLTIANSKCNADTKELGRAAIESAQSLERGVYEYYLKNSKDKYLDLKTIGLEGGSHIVDRNTLNDASGTYPILIYNNDGAHSNLYIKEDINVGFSGRSYNDINIPQVIIYSPGNIYIAPQVTRIDAWIIAGGEIRTCAEANGTVIRTQQGRVDECDKKLTITGPIYAKKILLDRIANGDVSKNTTAEPAELIDLNPAIYLFGYNESTNNAQPSVTYMHKLPVRY